MSDAASISVVLANSEDRNAHLLAKIGREPGTGPNLRDARNEIG